MSAEVVNNFPLKTWFEQDETLLRIRLSAPKANIIDAAMVAELRQAFDQLQGKNQLRAVLLDAEGLILVLVQVSKNIFRNSVLQCSKAFMHFCCKC